MAYYRNNTIIRSVLCACYSRLPLTPYLATFQLLVPLYTAVTKSTASSRLPLRIQGTNKIHFLVDRSSAARQHTVTVLLQPEAGRGNRGARSCNPVVYHSRLWNVTAGRRSYIGRKLVLAPKSVLNNYPYPTHPKNSVSPIHIRSCL
jgi:hypothetical protein